MRNYYYEKRPEGYAILEKRQDEPDVVFDILSDKEKTKSKVKFLNKGGAFDGWSPAFIFLRWKEKK